MANKRMGKKAAGIKVGTKERAKAKTPKDRVEEKEVKEEKAKERSMKWTS